VGKGSTFTVWLPVHPTDLEPITRAAALPTSTGSEPASILPEAGGELGK
jgi:hypothetical protein